MKKFIFALVGGSLALLSYAQEGTVRFNSDHSYRMLDHTSHVNRKQVELLQMRASTMPDDMAFYIGADMNVIANAQETNREAKFGYLMRHPTQNNQGGSSSSELVIHNANVQVTGFANPWVSVYAQLLYNPEQSFGQGTITDLNRNQISLRRGYVLVGNLDELPVYGSIGKMSVPFGLTDTVSPFTSSTVWHTFGGLAYGGLLGYEAHGFSLGAMAIQGGSQFRSANSGDDLPDDVANYALNAAYTLIMGEQRSVMVGASYIDGSAYCQGFPVKHFESCDGFKNPAWDAYGKLEWDRLTFIGEYAETTKDWPGTHNPAPPLDVFEAHGVTSFGLGAAYDLPVPGLPQDLRLSADFSVFESGPEGSPWEDQDQLVLGLAYKWSPSVKVFAEYTRTSGYAPLNFISGPDPFDPEKTPGTTHSDNGAESDVYLLGIRVAL